MREIIWRRLWLIVSLFLCKFAQVYLMCDAMKKLFRNIHLWLSLPFGIVITIICLTGAILVFEQDITKIVQRKFYYVQEVKGDPIPTDSLIQRIAPSLSEGVIVKEVITSDNPRHTYAFRLSKPRNAIIYVDPYTAEVVGRKARLPFFTTVLKLHRFLLDKRDANSGIFWGKMIVGVSTLLFVVILITGVVLWWPKSKKAWKTHFTIHLHSGWRRFLYDLHAVGGIYVLVFLLVLALTGLTWSFPWYKTLFYSIFDNAPRSLIYSIHVGSWGGMVSRILTFIAALLGATLPLTGYYLWIKRLMGKKKK